MNSVRPAIAVALAAACVLASFAQERTTPIKVGIYDNRPMVFLDEDDRPAGMQVDVISEIAKEQKWPIEFVHGTWQECLERLDHGDIDVLLDIGYSEERAKRFDFTNEALFSTWAQIYTPPGSDLVAIPDLAGKTIAVMRGDVHYAALRRLLGDFGINVRYAEFDDYKDLMQAVEHRRVDAGLFSRIAGLQLESSYGVHRSPIVLDPIQIRIAFPKGKNADLREAVDTSIRRLKRDPNSALNTSMEKWIGNVVPDTRPWWWKWAAAGFAAVVLVGIGINSLLRLEVRRKTSELSAKNIELEKEIASRARVESLLHAGREQLSTQSRALMSLARSDAIGSGDLESALRQITSIAVQTLQIDRSSAWVIDGDLSAIRCICLYEHSKRDFSRGAVLSRTDYPCYFDALG